MCISLALMGVATLADPSVPAMFSDHMVLQAGVKVPVWGTAEAGEAIEVHLGDEAPVRTVTSSGGMWKVELSPLRPGGPFTLTVRGNRTIAIHDVLVGEVWVLSGQSNMAFELNRASNGAAAVAAADHPEIRLFTVPERSAPRPAMSLDASWRICTPESARDFSAVGYFFGLELYRRLGVPIGLIHSSWPGTTAELWTPAKLLAADPVLQPIVRRWEQASAQSHELAERPAHFSLEFDSFELLRAADGHDAVALANFDDGRCRTVTGGVCGFREAVSAAVELSLVKPGDAGSGSALRLAGELDQAHAPTLELRYHEDWSPADVSMYKGIRFRYRGQGAFQFYSRQPTVTDYDDYGANPLQATPQWQTATIPFSALHQAGWGKALPFTPFALTSILLQVTPGDVEMQPGGLFNGMIAPLLPYAIRGAAWYQGESNGPRARQYETLLPAMIRGWRDAWGEGDFPFLIVQLPNHGGNGAEPSESMWAEMREAQWKTAHTVPHTGLAVTIDLGASDDVHPPRKEPVGQRLALQALAVAYGRKVEASGPVYESMRVDGSRVRVHFGSIGGGLALRDGAVLQGFAVAGADRHFHWATAAIDGDSVVMESPAVPGPVAVRYAWADDPDCNLVNSEGLPAAPFRSDDWPGITDAQR